MLKRNVGVSIVKEIGGIKTVEEAAGIFEKYMDKEHLARISHIKHPEIILKTANAISMCEPDNVFVNTGSEEDRQFIRNTSLKKGEEKALPMEGHTIHYDLKDEQARIIDRTFYIYNEGEHLSSLARKILRAEALETVRKHMKGIMHGKTMMIGFYMRGPIGAPVSNPALEITSSNYVMHS